MDYPKDFIELLNRCKANGFDDNFIIGSGNPDSRILFVGREPSGDALYTNTLGHYLENYKKGITDRWTRYRSQEIVEQGIEPSYWNNGQTVWYNYQKLFDNIYPEKEKDRKQIFDFEEEVFCTEMNGSWSKRTKDASTETIDIRKQVFFRDPYFNRFKVIVLACGNRINNSSNNPSKREIDSIFNVSFDKEFNYSRNNKYWTHYNSDRTLLVIHTRNLSAGVNPTMLKDMGDMIRSFIDSQNM